MKWQPSLNVPEEATIKTLVYIADGEPVVAPSRR